MTPRRVTACLWFLLALFGAACSPASANAPVVQSQASTAVPAAPIPTLPAGANGDSVVARVNAVEISLDTFNRALARAEQQQPTPFDAAALQNEVLDTLIEQSVIDQAAAAQGLSIPDSELDAELQSARTIAGSDADWQTWLGSNLFTEDEFRATLRDALLTSRVRDSVTGAIETGDLPYVHARHILVLSEAEANAVLQRLQNGEDFAAVAAQVSLDTTTKDNGGDLGWFSEADLLQPELARTALGLQPNMVAGPIRTDLGYHILQTLELENRPATDEQRAALAQIRFEYWLNAQMAGATIERFM